MASYLKYSRNYYYSYGFPGTLEGVTDFLNQSRSQQVRYTVIARRRKTKKTRNKQEGAIGTGIGN
jgi:hypothetical protein